MGGSKGGIPKRTTRVHGHMVLMAGSYKKEKLGEGNPMSWRNLGQQQGEELRRVRKDKILRRLEARMCLGMLRGITVLSDPTLLFLFGLVFVLEVIPDLTHVW